MDKLLAPYQYIGEASKRTSSSIHFPSVSDSKYKIVSDSIPGKMQSQPTKIRAAEKQKRRPYRKISNNGISLHMIFVLTLKYFHPRYNNYSNCNIIIGSKYTSTQIYLLLLLLSFPFPLLFFLFLFQFLQPCLRLDDTFDRTSTSSSFHFVFILYCLMTSILHIPKVSSQCVILNRSCISKNGSLFWNSMAAAWSTFSNHHFCPTGHPLPHQCTLA